MGGIHRLLIFYFSLFLDSVRVRFPLHDARMSIFVHPFTFYAGRSVPSLCPSQGSFPLILSCSPLPFLPSLSVQTRRRKEENYVLRFDSLQRCNGLILLHSFACQRYSHSTLTTLFFYKALFQKGCRARFFICRAASSGDRRPIMASWIMGYSASSSSGYVNR